MGEASWSGFRCVPLFRSTQPLHVRHTRGSTRTLHQNFKLPCGSCLVLEPRLVLEPLAFLLLGGAPALLQVAALVGTRCAVAATFVLFVEGPLSRIFPQTDRI